MKRKAKEKKKYYDYFLYFCFAITIFLSLTMFLALCNICYLPINTTGECVIARSIMSFDYYFIFLICETIFSIFITILYLIRGFHYKIKKYKIICILNILLQPLLVFFIIYILRWFYEEKNNYYTYLYYIRIYFI